VQLMMI